jgi:hypothetical protein
MDAPENIPEEKPPEPEMSPQRKWVLFAAGFLGWYLVNALIWFVLNGDLGAVCGIWLVNGFALLILALNHPTRPVALGILAALALNFVISLMAGLTDNALCFIPFFIK